MQFLKAQNVQNRIDFLDFPKIIVMLYHQQKSIVNNLDGFGRSFMRILNTIVPNIDP